MDEPTVYDQFLDDDGNAILRNCAVLYLDVLGIKDISMSHDRVERLRELLAALALAREEALVEQDEPWQALTWFTDNVVAAFPIMRGHIDEEPALGSALRAATYLQLRLAVSGFFARGGIAFGDIHMAQQVAFGPALIEANDLEGLAREPRVVLSPTAVDLQRKVMRSWVTDAAPQRFEMAIDEEGTVFVDYLGFWMDEEHSRRAFRHFLIGHRDSLVHELARHGQAPDVHRKFEWLAAYHNWVITTRLSRGRPFLVPGVSPGAFSHFS